MKPSSWPRVTCSHFFFSITLLPNLITLTSAVLSGRTMRIQPLGDSITFGLLSSDGNGYRNDLLQRLIAPIPGDTASANTVIYVGSVKQGTMTNNNNEGHSGAIISQIATFANLSLPERPNVVLLHAGTNDMTFNNMPTTAPDRISALIDQIHLQCPDALIVLAKILMSADNETQARSDVFNAALPVVVATKVAVGIKVQLVDMTVIPITELQDGVHPTDGGYNDMSTIWYAGLEAADTMGWIGEPVLKNISSPIVNNATATVKIITSGSPNPTLNPTTSSPPTASPTKKSGANGCSEAIASLGLIFLMVGGLAGVVGLV